MHTPLFVPIFQHFQNAEFYSGIIPSGRLPFKWHSEHHVVSGTAEAGGRGAPQILANQKTAALAPGRCITNCHPIFSDLPPFLRHDSWQTTKSKSLLNTNRMLQPAAAVALVQVSHAAVGGGGGGLLAFRTISFSWGLIMPAKGPFRNWCILHCTAAPAQLAS